MNLLELSTIGEKFPLFLQIRVNKYWIQNLFMIEINYGLGRDAQTRFTIRVATFNCVPYKKILRYFLSSLP